MSTTLQRTAERRSLSAYVGGGYGAFWHFKGRYRVCKGSRASKKSKTTALWYAAWLNKKGYENANLVVFRKTYRTLKDSCFTDLKWALNRLGVIRDWNINLSPLEMTRKSTGQKILFRGLDDPLKVTSITVEHGALCWAWLEEAYEVMNEDDFDMLDETIRGECPTPLFKQWTITFNPWNERHWLKHRFFDEPAGTDSEGNTIYRERKTPISADGEIMSLTTNYMCNEWLDDADKKVFERMKRTNPRRYAVAGLGGWGIVDGLIYENWKEQNFELISKKDYLALDEAHRSSKMWVFREDVETRCGLDFGYTNDPTAAPIMFLDKANSRLYIWDELYEKGLSNKKIYERLCSMGYGKERYVADSAEPKSIDELKSFGMRVRGAKKGKDSISNGIQWVQNLEIIIHPRCVKFLTEISNYSWLKDKFGKKLNEPIDDFNHLMDAMRYGLGYDIIDVVPTGINRNKGFSGGF